MAVTQEHSTVRTVPQQGEKRSRYKKGQAAKRAAGHARYGFLNHTFVPVIGQRLAALGSHRQVEREFFRSLSCLAALYGIPIPDVSAIGYPYNIAQAFRAIQKQMKILHPDLEVVIFNNTGHRSCLTTVKTFDTGAWLYYIPVKPLYLLLNDRKKKPQAELLLSVFGYLYQVVQIPYLTEGYICDTYEAIYDWCTDDPSAFDEGYYQHVMEEFRAIGYAGKRLLRSIRHPYHLQQFEKRVQRFHAITDNDKELLGISTKLLSLYRQNPSRSLFDNIGLGISNTAGEERIELYQYVSFFWSGEGAVYEQLMEVVNIHFQETIGMEGPQTIQVFDTPQHQERHDLDFERRLFACLQELNAYLNEC